MNYFPFLRGKQNELIAVRELAPSIVENGRVIPVTEPVNANSATRISIRRFVETSMPFLLICNPNYGDFTYNPDRLRMDLITPELTGRTNWTPAFIVHRQTTSSILEAFIRRYGGDHQIALIYYGLPDGRARSAITSHPFRWHVFMYDRVERSYIESLNPDLRVRISDPFVRQPRNALYPPIDFFTDLNTIARNHKRLHFGDFSIFGDHFAESGGAAHAVALHHVHYENGSRSLFVSHFVSDHRETSANIPGKTIEALNHLVNALNRLNPNNTQVCQEYREMAQSQQSRGLGYMKRLALKHHLEVMLTGGLES